MPEFNITKHMHLLDVLVVCNVDCGLECGMNWSVVRGMVWSMKWSSCKMWHGAMHKVWHEALAENTTLYATFHTRSVT